MKIALFLNKDIEANITYNLLKSELLKHQVKIFYSDTVGNNKTKPSKLIKLEYYEKQFIHNELIDFINKNQIETEFEFFDSNFKSFPIEKCSNVNSEEFIRELSKFAPDLFVSIRFGKIFKDEIINIPTNGLINLHSAILPDYRGIMGTLHAIKEQNKKIGCTLHTIPNSGIDNGEIIEIAECDVNYEKSLFWNIVKLYPIGANLIEKTIKNIERNNTIKSIKQNLEQGQYFSVPNQNDFVQIENLGMKIISRKDYTDIVEEYILKGLTKEQKRHLTRCISNSGLSDKTKV